jgi:hypothetical protein
MRRSIRSAAEAFALVERMSTWNAQITVRLRHMTMLVHQDTPGHGRQGWQRCEHEECRRVADLLNTDLPTGDQPT